jgi:hypothetical protein
MSAADFGHVHGIGVNPADGRVYVATHRGVFQLSERQPPVLVSDRVQDFMGFTVVGPDHFLAGGHPGDDSSASVGLIESPDAGATWTSRSLDGRADFHSLQFRHGFAEDGALIGVTPRGVVYASGDGGLTWDTRGTLNGLAEAVEAISGREIYAAADSAVLVSRDGGRTFAPLTP